MSGAHVKGTIMIEVLKYLRYHKEESRKVLPEQLQHYLSSRALATSWHPEEDYLELMRAIVELRPVPPEDATLGPWESAARASTVRYFDTGPYRALIRKGDPGRTLASLNAIWRLQHDTGGFEVLSEADNRAHMTLLDYAVNPGDSCALVQGMLWGLIHYSRGSNIELEHSDCRVKGASACAWAAAWNV